MWTGACGTQKVTTLGVKVRTRQADSEQAGESWGAVPGIPGVGIRSHPHPRRGGIGMSPQTHMTL